MDTTTLRLKTSAVIIAALIACFGYYNINSRQFRAAANSSGPPPAHTNAPGEANCVACHSDFPANSGGGSVVISGLPNHYTPGAQYPVTVTVNQTNAVVFGFQTTSVDNSNQTAGSFTLPIQNPQQTQIVQGIVNIGGTNISRRYVEHTQNGIIPTQFNTKSWTFNWTAPAQRAGRVRFFASGNGANSDGTTSGDYIYTMNAATCLLPNGSNFDADNRADIAVFRPSAGAWYRLNSSNGAFSGVQFGANGDRITPGDYDGDGRNDIAVFRNGNWFVIYSSNQSFNAFQFGSAGDIPVIGDYSGDGRSELAVFRPSAGAWYILNLANNQFTAVQWGANSDKPVGGDFDGDGRSDVAVYRPSAGAWYILQSSTNSFRGVQFGAAEDKPVSGDYDGDGKTDIAVFRPSAGAWYRLNSSNNQFVAVQFGISTDQPAPVDYDGDCITDIAVFRDGNWYILNSADNSFRSVSFGSPGDIPVPTAYTGQ